MRILIIFFLFFSSFSAFSQTPGVIIDSKQQPGLRTIKQQDGTDKYFLFNPNDMDKEVVTKATKELEEEIQFLQGQVEMMKKCHECYEELLASIDHDSLLLAELKKQKDKQ